MNVRLFRDGEILQTFELAEGAYVVGTGLSAHVRFESEYAASEQVLLKIGMSTASLADLGSEIPTYLGEKLD